MIYQHQYPPDAEKMIVEECMRTGETLPEAIGNKPNLFYGMALYYNAWFDLDLERDRQKLEPILRSQAFAYASDYEFTEDQAEDLWFYIQRMDKEFLSWYKSKLPKPKTPRGRVGRR